MPYTIFYIKRSQEFQFGVHQYKEELLANNPVVTVSIEMFETLETIEDYILNKLNAGDSSMHIEEKIVERSMNIVTLLTEIYSQIL